MVVLALSTNISLVSSISETIFINNNLVRIDEYKKEIDHTVSLSTLENRKLNIAGRHDPAIVHRARAVQDAVTAIVLCDSLALRFGTDWLGVDQ